MALGGILSAYVGQNIGNLNIERAKEAFKKAMILGAAFGGGMYAYSGVKNKKKEIKNNKRIQNWDNKRFFINSAIIENNFLFKKP